MEKFLKAKNSHLIPMMGGFGVMLLIALKPQPNPWWAIAFAFGLSVLGVVWYNRYQPGSD